MVLLVLRATPGLPLHLWHLFRKRSVFKDWHLIPWLFDLMLHLVSRGPRIAFSIPPPQLWESYRNEKALHMNSHRHRLESCWWIQPFIQEWQPALRRDLGLDNSCDGNIDLQSSCLVMVTTEVPWVHMHSKCSHRGHWELKPSTVLQNPDPQRWPVTIPL